MTLEFPSQSTWRFTQRAVFSLWQPLGNLWKSQSYPVNCLLTVLPHENASPWLPVLQACPVSSESPVHVPAFHSLFQLYSLDGHQAHPPTVPPGTLRFGFLCLVDFILVLITSSSCSSWTFMFGDDFSWFRFSFSPACKRLGSTHYSPLTAIHLGLAGCSAQRLPVIHQSLSSSLK